MSVNKRVIGWVGEGVSECEWKSDWVGQRWSEGVSVNKRVIGCVSAGVKMDGWVGEGVSE